MQEDYNSSLIRSLPGIVIQIDSQGKVIFCSDLAFQFLNLSKVSQIDKNYEIVIEKLFGPKFQVIAQNSILKVLDNIDRKVVFDCNLTKPSLNEEHSFEFSVIALNAGCLLVGMPTKLFLIDPSKITELRSSYERVLQQGNTIIIRTDALFSVSEVIGNCSGVFGIEPERFLRSGPAFWRRVVHKQDIYKLKEKISRLLVTPNEFTEELRIINQKNGKIKNLLLRVVPLFSSSNDLIGWEGIGIDITEIRHAEEEMSVQKQRIEALYEVSRALQLNVDPSLVASKGLRALIKATASEAGMVLFYDGKLDSLELVAAEGLSQRYVHEVEKLVNGPSLVRVSIHEKKGILVDNIQEDPRAVVKVAKLEGLKATVVHPLILGTRVLGAIVVSRKESRAYTVADFELIGAAANQFALATRQAELYANEKKQADFFAALYRLSHELTRHLSPKEISTHAFKVLHQELAAKRLWLGVINEQGTHILGQAGFGPGVRKRVVDLQIELNVDQNPLLDQVIRRKEPVIIYPEDLKTCSGLQLIFEKLDPAPFAVVPLVSLGQLVGIIIIEPSVGVGFFTPTRMSFLTSMASEIAVVLMANRFQNRMAEADKMRMAGLFASGVAHNFNNMLQAIIGQASLMDLQLKGDSSLKEAVNIIKSAASRGAALVKQLLSFSSSDTREKTNFSLTELIEQSKDLYKTILGSGIDFKIDLAEGDCRIYGDKGQIQQTVSNLLVNAKEAFESGIGQVSINCSRTKLRSGEIDPELAPGEYIRIEIRDNGVGMNEEMTSRCFEPFFTTKNVDAVTGIGIAGSGLGLSTAYSIMKQHDGLITVQSHEGEGSIFSIYIPAANRTNFSEEKIWPRVLTILLDPIQQVTVNTSLDSIGISPINCRSIDDFYTHMDSQGIITLVIIDTDRFEGDIVELISKYDQANSFTRFLVVSFATSRWKRLFAKLRNTYVYDKPITGWTLREILNDMVKHFHSTQTNIPVFGDSDLGKSRLNSKMQIEMVEKKASSEEVLINKTNKQPSKKNETFYSN